MWQACRTILRASERAARLPSMRSLTARSSRGRGPSRGRGSCRPRRPHQRSTARSLPGQAPGRAFAVRGPDGDVQPGEPDRLAGGGEPARAGQPAGQRQRGDRPDPVQPRVSTFAPVRCRAASSSRWRSTSRRRLERGEHVQGGGDLQLPGRRQVRGGGRTQRLQALARCAARPHPARGALMEEHRVDALHPGGVLGPQVVVGLQQRPALQDVRRRDPALGQPPVGQQLPQVPRVGLVGLGVPLAAPSAAVSAGSPTCAATPAAASSSATYRHPVHPSSANATSSRPANRPPARRQMLPVGRGDLPRCTSPVTVSR